MSTKNLARTAIEPGRGNHNKWERRQSHRIRRAASRALCNQALYSLDFDNEPRPRTDDLQPIWIEQRDKLGPVYRWLRSHRNENWTKVRALMFRTFETRTIAGRHIVYDHLLSSVVCLREFLYGGYGRNNDFYIDADGILLLNEKDNRWRRRWRGTGPSADEVTKWCQNRKVMIIDGQFFWAMPKTLNEMEGHLYGYGWACSGVWKLNRYHNHVTRIVKVAVGSRVGNTLRGLYPSEKDQNGLDVHYVMKEIRYCVQAGDYRQGTVLTEEEKRFWATLSEDQKKENLHLTSAQYMRKYREGRKAARAAAKK